MSKKTSSKKKATPAGEQVIVIHPPLTGDPRAVEEFNNGQVTTVILNETATVLEPQPASPTQPLAEVAPQPRGERALGLDALRGALLLAMTFAMTVPFGAFPNWMYHMQNPPPAGDYAAIAGLTWRDLMFPGFLFTMSAAIPITNSLRIAKGMPYPAVIFTALKRWALLMVFALIIGHVNPYWTEDYTRRGNFMAIAGFLLCWPIFTRKLAGWNENTYRTVRMVGWVAVAALLFAGPLIYGKQFSLERHDGIIAALAFCSTLAVCIWLATRARPLIRLGIIALIAGAHLAATWSGWVQNVWGATPAQWLYQSWYLELMIIVLAGTIAGDILLQWMKPRPITDAAVTWPNVRLAAIAAICAAFTPVAVVGLFNRNVEMTAAIIIPLVLVGAVLFINPVSERDRALAKLYFFGAFWITLGLVLEPAEGGIKKVPQTLSYLTLTAGLSMSLLIVSLILTDVFRSTRRVMRPIVDVGQNPLLAYIVFMLFLNHVAWASGLGRLGTGVWWQATLRGLVFTGLAAGIVILATRKKLFWRA
jgi:hypothetical protein